MARALIKRDATLFAETCVGLYAGHEGPAAYAAFLEDKIQDMQQPPSLSPVRPEKLVQVFAARHLRRNGPASYGYATFNFQDVMFVDVMVALHDGKRALHRTMVIQEPDGKWYAHPASPVEPLLSFGLDQERSSVQDFSEVYEVQRS